MTWGKLRESPPERCISSLPASYTNVPTVVSKTGKPAVSPVSESMMVRNQSTITDTISKEVDINKINKAGKTEMEIRNVNASIVGENTIKGQNKVGNKTIESISWSAFHAGRQAQVTLSVQRDLYCLFFRIVLIPCEVPKPGPNCGYCLIDQPLFALAKTIQWARKDSAGEDNLVDMLAGLYIEKAALKAIGTWLAGSGWVEVLSQAEITAAVRAESLINCAQITRTRYAHQGRVVQMPVNANLGLKVNQGLCFSC